MPDSARKRACLVDAPEGSAGTLPFALWNFVEPHWSKCRGITDPDGSGGHVSFRIARSSRP